MKRDANLSQNCTWDIVGQRARGQSEWQSGLFLQYSSAHDSKRTGSQKKWGIDIYVVFLKNGLKLERVKEWRRKRWGDTGWGVEKLAPQIALLCHKVCGNWFSHEEEGTSFL